MADLKTLLDEAREIIHEPRSFRPGEIIVPGVYNLGKLGHGANGDTYVVARVIVDRGDAQDMINSSLDYFIKQENVGLLKRAIASKSRSLEDLRTNETAIEAARRLLPEFEKLVLRTRPIHNRNDLRKFGGKSEIDIEILKWMPKEDYEGRPSKKDQMYNEMGLLSRLNSQHIARYVDKIEHKKGLGYLIERVDGRNIKDITEDAEVLKLREKTRKAEVYSTGFALFDSIAKMHGNGNEIYIVHNDIKPSNIMIVFIDGEFKMVDLGLAREQDPKNEIYLEKLMTDILYAAPEVISETEAGKPGSGSRFVSKNNAKIPFNGKTDVRMAGATLYELATGKLPYSESDPEEFRKEVIETDPKLISNYNPEFTKSESLELMRAMARNPDKRPDAIEMRDLCFRKLMNLGYDTPTKIHEIRRNWVEPIHKAILTRYETGKEEEFSTGPSAVSGGSIMED